MQESLKINVKLTEKDVKKFALANQLQGTHLYFLLYTIFVIVILSIALFMLSLVKNQELISSFALVASIVVGLHLLIIIAGYLVQLIAFKKSKIFMNLQCYEFSENQFIISNSSTRVALHLNDIAKVQELKPCFVISVASQVLLIPKRCFHNVMQLNQFLNLLHTSISPIDLKLKGYPVKEFSPDDKELEKSPCVTGEQNNADSYVDICFSLQKGDGFLSTSFKSYYTRPIGIIYTIIGLFFLYITISGVIGYTKRFTDFDFGIVLFFIPLIFGILFTLTCPLSMCLKAGMYLKNDFALKNPRTYRFYPNCFIATLPNIYQYNMVQSTVLWENVTSITETQKAYMLYLNPSIVHIIPKRVFENRPEDLKKFKAILQTVSSR